MKVEAHRLDDFVRHMLEAISRIERYTQRLDRADFLQDELVQDAVIRNIEIIGEAARNIQKHYPSFVLEHSRIPFASAYQMRNAVAHGYFAVDYELVWNTIQRDLPALRDLLLPLTPPR
ncbi:DUF86 domain-containing protein [Bordetella sp. LUAb4]|uniref:HepT-like ribonuclease domain-containing protein n=1 Tax=Bordetella sp. LUAb4 TaxID=2843195 RepID=UPI001E3F9B41|nr:DUF86 domain-containing protein [Bordetella sp. LUAb4]